MQPRSQRLADDYKEAFASSVCRSNHNKHPSSSTMPVSFTRQYFKEQLDLRDETERNHGMFQHVILLQKELEKRTKRPSIGDPTLAGMDHPQLSDLSKNSQLEWLKSQFLEVMRDKGMWRKIVVGACDDNYLFSFSSCVNYSSNDGSID